MQDLANNYMKTNATQQILNFIQQGHKVSYDLLMSFVDEYTDLRRATAECILRHQRDKVILIPKEPNKKNSPIIAYRWKEEIKEEPKPKDINKLF